MGETEVQSFRNKYESQIKEFRYTLHLLRKSPLALAGLVLLMLIFLVAIFAPYLAIEHPKYIRGQQTWSSDYAEVLKPPSWEHPFGTDDMGHDIYSMVVYGSREALYVGFIVVLVTTFIGVLLGAYSGYVGGWFDEIIMRICDIFFSIPSLILAMAITAALGPGLEHVMYALIFTWWPAYTRIVRGQVLSVKQNQYIEAARAVGVGRFKIIWKHVIPNSLPPILVQATMDLGNVILAAAGLAFLGLGGAPYTADWGVMVSQGRSWILAGKWWWSTFPGLAIFITVLAFNLFGDGLRDILDPRLRR
ncbi:MAG: ABC transporter permease [Thermoplasmata archaeon]|nr:ABC transporter permease [Thermoplasmata archaeon]